MAQVPVLVDVDGIVAQGAAVLTHDIHRAVDQRVFRQAFFHRRQIAAGDPLSQHGSFAVGLEGFVGLLQEIGQVVVASWHIAFDRRDGGGGRFEGRGWFFSTTSSSTGSSTSAGSSASASSSTRPVLQDRSVQMDLKALPHQIHRLPAIGSRSAARPIR